MTVALRRCSRYLKRRYAFEVVRVVGNQRHTVPHGARGDPGVIRSNRCSAPLPFGDQATVATRDPVIVGDNDKVAESRFKEPSSPLTPVGLLRTEV